MAWSWASSCRSPWSRWRSPAGISRPAKRRLDVLATISLVAQDRNGHATAGRSGETRRFADPTAGARSQCQNNHGTGAGRSGGTVARPAGTDQERPAAPPPAAVPPAAGAPASAPTPPAGGPPTVALPTTPTRPAQRRHPRPHPQCRPPLAARARRHRRPPCREPAIPPAGDPLAPPSFSQLADAHRSQGLAKRAGPPICCAIQSMARCRSSPAARKRGWSMPAPSPPMASNRSSPSS